MERLEIIEYLPLFVQEYREIKEIMSTEQKELNTLWEECRKTLVNNFIPTADEMGIEKYESIFGILKYADATLEERKFRILTYINGQLPYTYRALENNLTTLCGPDGFKLELDHDNYYISVKVELTAKNNVEAVRELLHRVLPANLVIDLQLIYNQYKTLAKHTHGSLSKYTHRQLRNEVLGVG